MHGEPLIRQRAQMGCSLLHLTFDAAHVSHEALSFGFLSLFEAVVLAAEVGGGMAAEGGISMLVGGSGHCDG